MRGKTVVITGGTSGIGEIAAETLAKMGARIVLVARDKSRAERTLSRLRSLASPSVAHSVCFADLTRLAEVKRVAMEIANQEPRIDVLINNAGALFGTRRLTEDGLEYTFALNHMAYFVLTVGLRERLLASRPACVINTASASHQRATLDFDVAELRGREGLWSLEALQHPVHPGTCSPFARHRRDRELPASWIRRHAHRRPERWVDFLPHAVC